MEILLVLTTGALCIACFFIGARVGQKVGKGEDITLPKIDPMQPIRERKERKQADKEQERYYTMLENIDCYDGTSSGQKDIPR